MAGREALFTDACVNGHLVDALVLRGWDVMRVIDVYPEKTPDPVVFERAAKEGRVFVTNDEGILTPSAIRSFGSGRDVRIDCASASPIGDEQALGGALGGDPAF